MSCETVEDVLAKKKDLEDKILMLDKRIGEISSRKTVENAEDSLSSQALAELRESFSVRKEGYQTREQDLGWILSPKNIGRCKILKKTPENMLSELEAWYDGQKTS